MGVSYSTRATAQRAANKANDFDDEAFYVVGHDAETGWFIENLHAPEFDRAAELASFKRATVR